MTESAISIPASRAKGCINDRSCAVWGREVPGSYERVHRCSRQTLKTSVPASQTTGLSAGHLNCVSPINE
jgi:hypothetical protein